VIRTLRYLKGTQEKGIFFLENNQVTFTAYSDSDYAGDENDRKSTTRYLIMLGKIPISWCSRKQRIVAFSTTQAEYITAAEC